MSLSLIGRANLIKMPQLLYLLHNSPVDVPLDVFWLVNAIFCTLLWKDKSPRIKSEQLQHPKDWGGIALPNPWLHYLASQMQHLIGTFSGGPSSTSSMSPSTHSIMRHRMKVRDIPRGLDASCFATSNRTYPTYSLIPKNWLKVHALQGVTGFTEYSPLLDNSAYGELMKLPCAVWWKMRGITHLRQILQNGNFCSVEDLQTTFHLPPRILLLAA